MMKMMTKYSTRNEGSELKRKSTYNIDRNTNMTQSLFGMKEALKTLKISSDILNCYKLLTIQENDSVLKAVRSWISNIKLPTQDV